VEEKTLMAIHTFKAEVTQLLHLIIHSLYSHREIFLRELISNASDALDKLKYLTLTDSRFKDMPFEPRIDVLFDEKKSKTLTVSDTGIGMNEEDLIQNLGMIASSGTRNFIEKMTGDARKDASLIGQFGVGFYSVFMVSEKVEIISLKTGEEKAYKWISDGKGDFEVKDADRDSNGTTVICYLTEDGKEYANRWRIESVAKKYSNHIPFPIYLHFEEKRLDGEGEKKQERREQKVEQINAASAFWKRPKSELSEEDYTGFYKTLSHDQEPPLHYLHTHAEGALEYSTLFYIPRKAPPDMFQVDYQSGVKLYVKRVFITDDDRELMPTYMRFIRGIIDSEDLPLNVSREVLQKNRIIENIRNVSVKKILGELVDLAKKGDEKYQQFYKQYRIPLKEGLYQDYSNRDIIMELVRFKSTTLDGYTSFAEYLDRKKDDQKVIYYITGANEENVRRSPLLEVYREKGIEVLIMDDEIDEIVVPAIGAYKDTELRAVNRSDATEDIVKEGNDERNEQLQPLLMRIKEVFGERVKDVRMSERLTDSPSCIVADGSDPTIQMQHLMELMGQKSEENFRPVLEINPGHPIIKKMGSVEDRELFEDIAWLLLEQAMLIEGAPPKDITAFTRRLNSIMAKAL
jgi:molecular chaperone HtpG